MRLTHVNITIPQGGEDAARAFYSNLLGLKEIPKPEPIRHRGGVWFDAGGLDLHLSVEEPRTGGDTYRHFGLECEDVPGLRARLTAAGIAIDTGRLPPGNSCMIPLAIASKSMNEERCGARQQH